MVTIIRKDWREKLGLPVPKTQEDLATLAQKASAGSVRFRLPEGRDLTRAIIGRADLHNISADNSATVLMCIPGDCRFMRLKDFLSR